MARRIIEDVTPQSSRPHFLTAEWRKLLMVQYVVEPDVLAPYMPRGVELDFYQGQCFVSLVGFLFDRVRVKGIPVPFHTRFEEVNLRFYVKRTEADGTVRRGVVFVNEFVPRLAIALVAKHVYEEPYRAMPMRHSFEHTAEALDVSFGWKTGGRWHEVAASAAAESRAIAAGSVEEFITEHYWGYTRRSNGSTSVYQVEHPRWEVYTVRSWSAELDFAAMYGTEWQFLNAAPAANVLLAEGSAVTVYGDAPLLSAASNV